MHQRFHTVRFVHTSKLSDRGCQIQDLDIQILNKFVENTAKVMITYESIPYGYER